MAFRLAAIGLRQILRLLLLRCRSSRSKDLELLVLRQELDVLHRQVPRPRFRPEERRVLSPCDQSANVCRPLLRPTRSAVGIVSSPGPSGATPIGSCREGGHRPVPQPRPAVLVGRTHPQHRESDVKVHRGGITKQGSPHRALGRHRGHLSRPGHRRGRALRAGPAAPEDQRRPGGRRPANFFTSSSTG